MCCSNGRINVILDSPAVMRAWRWRAREHRRKADAAAPGEKEKDIVPDIALFAQVLRPANRADPIGLCASARNPILRMRMEPISSATTPKSAASQDSRVSSEDIRYLACEDGNPILDFIINPDSRTGSLKRIVPCCFATLPIRRPAAA